MAAIVTGLIPILRTAVDSTTTYKGRAVWFGFLAIRLVTLFVAEMPWFKLDVDFSCNASTDVCTRACFNQHFDKPLLMAWNFLFILLVLSVVLMELFTAHVRTVFQKRVLKENSGVEVGSLGELKGDMSGKPTGVMMLDMHGSKTAVLSYLFSMILRIIVEVWFVFVLVSWNLPKLVDTLIECKYSNCAVKQCIVRATAEKRMSIYALLTISSLVICTSCLFCLYFIGHYFCNCWTKRSSCV